MGSLVSGIYGLVAGDPTQKEENQLGQIGGYETGTGEGLTTDAAKFDEAILSGDPTKIAQALAPQISAQQSQIQQQAKQNAEFGTRSGGTAASTAGAEAAGRGNIINEVGGLQSTTANNAGSLGSNLLGEASSNIGAEAGLASKAAANKQADVGNIAQGAAEIAEMGFGGLDAIGGPSPAVEAGTSAGENYSPSAGIEGIYQ